MKRKVLDERHIDLASKMNAPPPASRSSSASRGNVTIDPASQATPVPDPQIQEIIDLVSGEILDSRSFIGAHRYDLLVQKRGLILEAMKANTPLYACAVCHTPVYLVSSSIKQFFFRHRTEDGRCPAVTREPLSREQILERKYHGLRESRAHKTLKSLIERGLRADCRFDQDSILTEIVWKSQNDPDRWRKPDIQATLGGQRFAFEAQLSTTFLHVVVGRRSFYRNDSALLVWVLSAFDPADRRLTIDDILFSNNANILVVDDETTTLSEKEREFFVKCHFRKVSVTDETVAESWDVEIVSFHRLRRDIGKQQLFLYDHESIRNTLSEDVFRQLVFAFWRTLDRSDTNYPKWAKIRAEFASRKIVVPERPQSDKDFRAMMNGLLSAMDGVPVGWNFKRLIEVAHYIAEQHPQHLLAFGYAIEQFGHKHLLREQDTSGKWGSRVAALRPLMKNRDPKYLPHRSWFEVQSFLFPEISARINEFITGE